MLEKLMEAVLPSIIGIMVHKREVLTVKESYIQTQMMSKISVLQRLTEKPIIIAMIGLVGSGKSRVSRECAPLIGATIINADEIRVELRKQGERFERARAIAENLALEVVRKGGNVILDSDFIDPKKRASLREKGKKAGIRVAFLCTYCDLDVAVGRAISAPYQASEEDFFGGAHSKWNGGAQEKGAVVKLREMLRRTPLHYKWANKGGGQWIIKNPPCTVLADIDTSTDESWKREVHDCARELLVQ